MNGENPMARRKSSDGTTPPNTTPSSPVQVHNAAKIPSTDMGNPQFGSTTTGTSTDVGSTIIEVQFRPEATGIAFMLATDMQGFLHTAVAGGSVSGGTERVQAVLLRYKPNASSPSFTSESIQADLSRLAQAAVTGNAAPPDGLANIPPLQSFVRLQFDNVTMAMEVARTLQALPEVEKARLVPLAAPPHVIVPPHDPLIGVGGDDIQIDPVSGLESQWYLHRTSIPDAWRLGATGFGVVIADIDWGYRLTHQELHTRLELENAYNSVDGSQNVSVGASIGHGTGVLGIVGAAADGRGMAGVAPDADLWPIQSNSGAGILISHDPWADAIEHVRLANSHGRRKVIILEVQSAPALGNYEQVPSVNAAIRRAIADNVVVCVAAGNGDRAADIADDGITPIDPTGSILVGATEWDPREDRRAGFSNWGSRIVVSAPGDPLHDLTCSFTGDGDYRNGFGGTSGATPKVAGVVALMLSVNPNLSHNDVREILRGTGSEIAPDLVPEKRIGVFLDAEAAVREALRRAGIDVPQEVPVTPASIHIEGLGRTAPVSKRRTSPQFTRSITAGSSPSALDRTLREFRQSTEGLMTQAQQLLAIDQAIHLLDLFYVHRPLKEAMHAVRPIQRLRVLRRRLEEEPETWLGREELRFHNILTDIFTSNRDLHTNYLLPQPYQDYTAFLPFLVRPYFESVGRRRYLVTQVIKTFPFANPDFMPGVEILSWNGVAIETAVEINAHQTAGSNLAARHARGVDALTLRPMNVALPPEADWVHILFRDAGGVEHEMRQDWLVRFTPLNAEGASGSLSTLTARRTPATTPSAPQRNPRIQDEVAFSLDAPGSAYNSMQELLFTSESSLTSVQPSVSVPVTTPLSSQPDPQLVEYSASLGIDIASDAVREVKQLLFTPETVTAAGQRALSGSAEEYVLEGEDIKSLTPLVFQARRLLIGGREWAYIRIQTFKVNDPDAFVREFIRLAALLPQNGLLIDVRGNGGGHIFAAERLLQTLTPLPIEPERLQFISTLGTLELCRRNQSLPVNLSPWLGSLEQSVLTGSIYSQALPITDPDSCNSIGQCYQGPVALLIDGRCYSATDIFAAGFQDHGIGIIIGTSPQTGAGGANVWSHALLHDLYASEGSPLRPLPHKMGMRIAIRQTLRVGARAGTLLEDFGVTPELDRLHKTTRRDLLEQDIDLFTFATNLLVKEPIYRLKLDEMGRPAGQITFQVLSQNISRLNFFLNGHPATSVLISQGTPAPTFTVNVGTQVELRGFVVDASTGKERCVVALKQKV